MDSETSKVAQSMHHSKELQEEVYSKHLDTQKATDLEAIKSVAYAMHHSKEMQENIYNLQS